MIHLRDIPTEQLANELFRRGCQREKGFSFMRQMYHAIEDPPSQLSYYLVHFGLDRYLPVRVSMEYSEMWESLDSLNVITHNYLVSMREYPYYVRINNPIQVAYSRPLLDTDPLI